MRSPEAPSTTRLRPDEKPLQRYTVRLGAEPWPQERVGGKANGLVRLARAGMNVPTGFVVTSDAFDEVVDRLLVEEIETLAELREALRSVDLPVTLLDEISVHIAEEPAQKWAVRSSALEEDGAEQSFAGQHVTVLDVRGREAIADAIREVWSGALAEHALRYRVQLAVDAVPSGLAVVVQKMVKPDVAGVTFTVNPLADAEQNNDRTEAVVCAARGLGVAVVGGEACDTYYVERPSGYVHRSDVQDDTLDSADLHDMVRYCERAERAFGHPLDLEWAMIDGEFVFLQARSITGRRDVEESVWTNSNVGEALPGVATPLTWSIIRRFSRRGFERAFGSLGLHVPEDYELVGSFAGRVYLNLTQFAEITSHIPFLSPDTLFEMAGGGGVELVRDIYEHRDPTGFLLRLPTTVPRVLGSQLAMPVLTPLWDAVFRAWCESFFSKDLKRLNHKALGEELARLDGMFDWNGEFMLAGASNFLMSYVVARETIRMFGRSHVHGREQELLGGLHVSSAEPGLVLLELGRIARRSRRIRRIIETTDTAETYAQLREHAHHSDVELFLEAFDAFRREFGHRAPREAELATPRWREDTRFLFEVLRGFLAAPDLPTKLEVDRDRSRARDEVQRIVDRAFGVGASRLFKGLLGLLRGNTRRREVLRNRVVDSLDMYRRYFLEVGRRLYERGELVRADDVFYLTIEEIRHWLDDVSESDQFRYRVLVRRALHDIFADEPDPPNVFVLRGSDMVPEESYGARYSVRPLTGKYREISGLPASPGRVTGKVRVINDPAEAASLKPGELLVVPYADVGWTPMFLTAAAVVMDFGGPLSHASIVAREYGVPAVVNARGILQEVETGDTITVDGDRGVVYVKESD